MSGDLLIGKHLPAEVGQVLIPGPSRAPRELSCRVLLLRMHGSVEPVAHDRLSNGFSASCQFSGGRHAQKTAHELSGC
jgi:hypothetical protein